MDETFLPLSDVSIGISPEGNATAQRKVPTDEYGSFLVSDLPPGKYMVRADRPGFIGVEIHEVLIRDTEDYRLRRILLATGEAAGNCVVRINSKSRIQHTGRRQIQIKGRIQLRHDELAVVNLVVFAENEQMPIGFIPTDKGRFRTNISVAGDIRMRVELRTSAGNTVVPEQELNLAWADPGDVIRIPEIKLNRSGLGHFCY